MTLTIKKFSFITLFLLFGVLYGSFAKYYFDQRQKTAHVILKGLQNDMSELSYILSKNIKSKESVKSLRAMLERAVSNNDFINAIMIADDTKILLTTDRNYKSIPSKYLLSSSLAMDSYTKLLDKKGIEGIIRFYQSNIRHEVNLLFMLDKGEIRSHFERDKTRFLLFFGLIPISVLAAIWIALQFFISRPLERLRQYAYYQNSVPKSFRLRELEAIRSSMVQTFTRLEEEQKELYQIARTDVLSGLANRNALHEYLDRLIADSRRTKKEFAFLFLDLDHFKDVNDALGHNIGDELLKKVASVIQEVLRSNDFVARVGGDEFVIVLHQYNSLIELTTIIKRIQERLSQTWLVQTHPIDITSSVGVAFFPKDGEDIGSLMQHADIAMYEAKNKGRAQYHFFTEELNAKVQENIALDKAMRDALKANEYELYYQPKVNLKNGKIIGAEALVRWISPTKGIIPPNVFIPLAEENGFIIELGHWILEEALKQQVQWQQQGLDTVISINIATQQLLDGLFEEKLTQLLKKYKTEPSRIDFEITEYLFMEQTEINTEKLDMVHQQGISISLDDFGTGYSSLSYLKDFPIDHLKIDKAFVDDFNNPQGAIFLETIVKMGQTLGMDIIAEGVETREQARYLKSIGCDIYQGYYCSKPLNVEKFEEFYVNYVPFKCSID